MASKDFVYTWKSGNRRWYSPGFGEGEYTARSYFWDYYQYKLLTELQAEYDDGWKPITEIGPSAFVLRQYKKRELYIQVMDVILWIVSLGLMFLLEALTGQLTRTRIYYEATEFRVALRK